MDAAMLICIVEAVVMLIISLYSKKNDIPLVKFNVKENLLIFIIAIVIEVVVRYLFKYNDPYNFIFIDSLIFGIIVNQFMLISKNNK